MITIIKLLMKRKKIKLWYFAHPCTVDLLEGRHLTETFSQPVCAGLNNAHAAGG